MKRAQKDPFAVVDQLVAAFRNVDGFVPNTFVAWAEPEALAHNGEADSAPQPSGVIARSFRYEAWGCIARVTVHGSPRSTWHRRVASGLTKAGYELRLRFSDETAFQRALTSARARTAELAFLRTLGEKGTIARWPVRALEPKRHVRVARNSWAPTIAAVRASGIAWTDASVGFTRSAPLSTKNGPSEVHLRVSALVLELSPSRMVQVSVTLFDPKRNRAEVPTTLMHRLRRDLRRAGYRFTGVKGAGGVRIAGRLYADKMMSSATQAARECAWIFGHLVAEAREVRVPDR